MSRDAGNSSRHTYQVPETSIYSIEEQRNKATVILENLRLKKENDELWLCLKLMRDNSQLESANLISSVIAWCDEKFKRRFIELNTAINRHNITPSPFRPITPVQSPVSDTLSPGACRSPYNNLSADHTISGLNVASTSRQSPVGVILRYSPVVLRGNRNVSPTQGSIYDGQMQSVSPGIISPMTYVQQTVRSASPTQGSVYETLPYNSNSRTVAVPPRSISPYFSRAQGSHSHVRSTSPTQGSVYEGYQHRLHDQGGYISPQSIYSRTSNIQHGSRSISSVAPFQTVSPTQGSVYEQYQRSGSVSPRHFSPVASVSPSMDYYRASISPHTRSPVTVDTFNNQVRCNACSPTQGSVYGTATLSPHNISPLHYGSNEQLRVQASSPTQGSVYEPQHVPNLRSPVNVSPLFQAAFNGRRSRSVSPAQDVISPRNTSPVSQRSGRRSHSVSPTQDRIYKAHKEIVCISPRSVSPAIQSSPSQGFVNENYGMSNSGQARSPRVTPPVSVPSPIGDNFRRLPEDEYIRSRSVTPAQRSSLQSSVNEIPTSQHVGYTSPRSTSPIPIPPTQGYDTHPEYSFRSVSPSAQKSPIGQSSYRTPIIYSPVGHNTFDDSRTANTPEYGTNYQRSSSRNSVSPSSYDGRSSRHSGGRVSSRGFSPDVPASPHTGTPRTSPIGTSPAYHHQPYYSPEHNNSPFYRPISPSRITRHTPEYTKPPKHSNIVTSQNSIPPSNVDGRGSGHSGSRTSPSELSTDKPPSPHQTALSRMSPIGSYNQQTQYSPKYNNSPFYRPVSPSQITGHTGYPTEQGQSPKHSNRPTSRNSISPSSYDRYSGSRISSRGFSPDGPTSPHQTGTPHTSPVGHSPNYQQQLDNSPEHNNSRFYRPISPSQIIQQCASLSDKRYSPKQQNNRKSPELSTTRESKDSSGFFQGSQTYGRYPSTLSSGAFQSTLNSLVRPSPIYQQPTRDTRISSTSPIFWQQVSSPNHQSDLSERFDKPMTIQELMFGPSQDSKPGSHVHESATFVPEMDAEERVPTPYPEEPPHLQHPTTRNLISEPRTSSFGVPIAHSSPNRASKTNFSVSPILEQEEQEGFIEMQRQSPSPVHQVPVATSPVIRPNTFKPSHRLLGEIAFQLERRILDFIFAKRVKGEKERLHRRFYGYTVSNIPAMITREATSKSGTLDVKKKLTYQYHYDNILLSLEIFGYIVDKHCHFCLKMINKYGLLSQPPDRQTMDVCGLQDPNTLRMFVASLAQHEKERSNMMIVLECLLLLAHDDRQSIFLW